MADDTGDTTGRAEEAGASHASASSDEVKAALQNRLSRMQVKVTEAPVVKRTSDRVTRTTDRMSQTLGGRIVLELKHADVISQAMLLAATALVTVFPLMMVLASFGGRGGYVNHLVQVMGVNGEASDILKSVFSTPEQVRSGETVSSYIVLGLAGLGFASSIQHVYDSAWFLPSLGWSQFWRKVVWGLITVVGAWGFSFARSGIDNRGLVLLPFLPLAILYLWFSAHLLLGGRVPWRKLLPTAIVTGIAVTGLQGFSALFFSSSLISGYRQYGEIGTIFTLLSYFIGLSVVLIGGAIVGAAIAGATPPNEEGAAV